MKQEIWKKYLIVFLVLLVCFPLFARKNTEGEYIRPNVAFTAYYDSISKMMARVTVYGMTKYVGAYFSYGAFNMHLPSKNIGSVDSNLNVNLYYGHQPYDANSNTKYYLTSAYSQFYQNGMFYGGVFRIGNHFNVLVGTGNTKATEYVSGTYKYTNINGYERYGYTKSDEYLLNRSYYDVSVSCYEFGVLVTINNGLAADFFVSYTPAIDKYMFFGGIGYSY